MVSLSTSFTLNSSSETSNLPVFPPLIAFSIADVIEFCHSSPVFLKPRALSSILKTGGSRLSACRCIRSFSSYFSLLGLYLEQLLFSPQCCIFPQNWLYNPTFNSYRAIATSFFYTASHFPCHPFFLIPSLIPHSQAHRLYSSPSHFTPVQSYSSTVYPLQPTKGRETSAEDILPHSLYAAESCSACHIACAYRKP